MYDDKDSNNLLINENWFSVQSEIIELKQTKLR